MKKLFSFFAIVISIYSFAADYYWVGGSGNWNDINHWRNTSGGTGIPSVVPGPTDNVYFDVNSGFTTNNQTVTLNVTGNCNNITFSGSAVTPTFTQAGSQTFNIYGSSEWQSGMPPIIISTINYRNTNTPKTIKSNGVTLGTTNTITNFEEKSSITLADNLRINGNVYLREGTFNTNNYDFRIAYRFYAQFAASNTKIVLGSSNVYLESTGPVFNTSSQNITVDAGTSHIIFENMTSLSGGGFSYYNNQVFNNVSFLGTLGNLSNNGTFNKVIFSGDGNINGNNQYNELTFSASKVYTLEQGKTQTIITKFSALTPSCGGWATIKSSTEGTTTSIAASNTAVIELSGAVMKDIHAIGTANFTASNSVDNGNNTGWIFSTSVVENLYWVGGSGNWNEQSHWSNSSGGAGGYCVPGPNNNTFFDINSGFTPTSNTVTINNLSYTKNITFSGSAVTPTFTQTGSQIFNIYGSSEWQSGMPPINISTINYRNTNTPKTIKSNGVTIGASNTITNFEEKSSITLADNFRINGNVNLREGTFNTNNYDFRIVYRFNAQSAASNTKIVLGSSNVYLESTSPVFNTNSQNITVDAGTSHIIFENMTSLSGGGFSYYNNQVFNNVSFLGTLGNLSFLGTSSNLSRNGIFNKVIFSGDGIINGNNQYNELTFSASKIYTLEQGKTQTIITKFSALTPSCGGWATIKSSTDGTTTSIAASNTTVIELSGAVMKDIHGVGTANFTATNSVDNGNNTGWIFPATPGENLYWVGGTGNWNEQSHWSNSSGGAGGYCVPGPNNNTFFDINSGFTPTSKTVTIDNLSYTKNITFSGSAVTPTFTQTGSQIFNIYGSSEWQSGMPDIIISTINYRNTNTPKTIKSNGVTLGTTNTITNFEEKSSITLADNFRINGNVNLREGTFDTNNHDFRIVYRFNAQSAASNTKIVLGSSNVYLESTSPLFNTSTQNITVDAGTSHIIFENMTSLSGGGFSYYNNQVFNNVSFLGTLGNLSNNGTFNKVIFLGNGNINGDNTFKDLIFSAGNTYTLQANQTQIIDNLILGGTPCEVTFVQSSTPGTRTNINVTGTSRTFNFANLKDINAINSLHFGETSTIANQNNNNITFAPYDPGAFSGFEGDKLCPTFVTLDDYFIDTDSFYGNPETTYTWYKTGGPNADVDTIISTDSKIDLRVFGYGRYKVIVKYSNICIVEEEITIKDCPAKVNPNLRIKVK